MSSIACHFTVTGDFDPNEFTRRVGLEPSRTWNKGDRVGESLIRRKRDGWQRSIGRQASPDLAKVLKQLLEEVLPAATAIVRECNTHGLDREVACVVYVGSPAPAAHLDTDILQSIALLGASLDLDLYVDAEAWSGTE